MIFLITGKSGAGKSTVAKYLSDILQRSIHTDTMTFVKTEIFSVASPLKNFLEKKGYNVKTKTDSIRFLLQIVGQTFRGMIRKVIKIKNCYIVLGKSYIRFYYDKEKILTNLPKLIKDIKKNYDCKPTFFVDYLIHRMMNSKAYMKIVDDVRFSNEIYNIILDPKEEIYILKIRPDESQKVYLLKTNKNDISETSLDNFKFNKEFPNVPVFEIITSDFKKSEMSETNLIAQLVAVRNVILEGKNITKPIVTVKKSLDEI